MKKKATYSANDLAKIFKEIALYGLDAVAKKHGIQFTIQASDDNIGTDNQQSTDEIRLLHTRLAHLEQNSSHSQFQCILEGAPEPVFIQTDKKFVWLNRAACSMFGIDSPEEMTGREVLDFIHPDFKEDVLNRMYKVNQVKQPITELSEVKFIRPDGTEIWAETTGEPCVFNGVNGAMVFVRDISARKKLEQSFLESEQRIQYALEISKIGIWDTDLQTFTLNHSFTMDQIYGYQEKVQEWTAERFRQHIHPDDQDNVFQAMQQAIDTLQDWQSEFRIYRTDGTMRWLHAFGRCLADENGKPYQMIGITQDITKRKEIEATLKYNYAMLRFAGNIAKFGSWSVENGSDIVHWSETVARIHEMPEDYYPTVDEAINFYAPEWRDKISHAFLRCVKEGHPFSEEMEIISRKGKRVWIRTMGEAVWENGKIVKVQGALQDISDFKQAQFEIQESETKFRNLFQNHSAVKLIIDPDTGAIIEANESASRYYGWTVEEMKKMNISQINALSEGEIKAEIDKVRNSSSSHFNFRHRISDGTIRDVEVFSSSFVIDGKEYLHSVIHDVTEKRKAERQLKLLSRSVEQSPVSVVITDTEGNIDYANPSFSCITGYTLEEIKGKNLRILKSDHHTPEFYKKLWDTIRQGKDWSGEFLNRKKDGQKYWEDTIISPILNDMGEISNYVAITEDITERKKMVQELMEAKTRAEESDKLKTAFLTNMSHEIRTPMNGILGFTEILKDPGLSGEKQQEFIDIIQKSGRRMLDTVNDLMDISKIETGQVKVIYTETKINERIQNLYKTFLPQAQEKGLKLMVKKLLPAKYSTLQTDQSKLDTILTNLIKNAIKFTEKGEIEIGCIPRNQMLEFFIRDTGIGVPDEKQEAIFNRFVQADYEDIRAYQGSGLGLAICKAYVEMLNGSIMLNSKVGEGSTFYFTLPAPQVREETQWRTDENKPKNASIPQLEGKKILIAEDDQYGLELMLFMLKKTRASIAWAKNGQEAVDKARKDSFDLVLLDIRLPQLDGFEVLRQIREQKPNQLVIAQSAFSMTDDISSFENAGFNDYISKPINLDHFYQKLHKYLGNES